MIFDQDTSRRGTNSYKWDSRPDVPADTIPLWVADMDFKVAAPIQEALQKRVDTGIFGYTFVPDAYYEALTRWFGERHGWHIPAQSVIYTSGVVPAISAIIKAMTRPGQKVLIMTPVYNCFFSSIRNNGCEPLESALILEDDTYAIDFDDVERKAADPLCTLMLICNPHNPACRAWTASELSRLDDICVRHGLLPVSDEIHCELVFKPYAYTPFATVAKGDWVACVSPSKAFNIAGLQIANIVSSSPKIREKVDRAINDNEVCDVNPFGVDALIAAYNHGAAWLDSLVDYLHGNYLALKEAFASEAPACKVINLEATYLAWIDCRHIAMDSADLEEYLIKEAHVWVNAGSMYGADGEGFIRINMGCPRHRLMEGLRRLLPVLNRLSTSINN